MKRIYICFPEGKNKVFTLSYDDGKNADKRLVEIFNKYKIKATFHLNSGLLGKIDRVHEDEVEELYKGHEVAVHTFNHPTISRVPKEELVLQIFEDRKILEKIVGYPVRGMSYPNGSYTEEIVKLLPHLGIEYSRVVGGHETYNIPENFLKWQSTCHHNQNALKHVKEFLSLSKTQYLYMFYIWGHSYEFDNDNNWDLIEEICERMSFKDDIWYATNIEIVDYLNATKNLKFNVERTQVINMSNIDIWLDIDGIKKKISSGINEI